MKCDNCAGDTEEYNICHDCWQRSEADNGKAWTEVRRLLGCLNRITKERDSLRTQLQQAEANLRIATECNRVVSGELRLAQESRERLLEEVKAMRGVVTAVGKYFKAVTGGIFTSTIYDLWVEVVTAYNTLAALEGGGGDAS